MENNAHLCEYPNCCNTWRARFNTRYVCLEHLHLLRANQREHLRRINWAHRDLAHVLTEAGATVTAEQVAKVWEPIKQITSMG